MKKKILGDENSDVATSLGNLAELLRELVSRWAELSVNTLRLQLSVRRGGLKRQNLCTVKPLLLTERFSETRPQKSQLISTT